MKERVFHGPSHNVFIFVDVIYYPAMSVCICLLLLFLRLCLGWVAVCLCSEVCSYLHLWSHSVPPVLSLCFLFSVMCLLLW